MRSKAETRYFVRDDQETELEILYTVTGGMAPSGLSGPYENYDPGSAPEVTIDHAYDISVANKADREDVELTENETERFQDEVINDPETWEPEEREHD